MAYSERNPETGSGQSIWPGGIPQPLGEIATRGDGFALALGGAAAVLVGALLPFVSNVQEMVYETPYPTGFQVNAGGRFLSFLFGLLLAGLAVWARYRPVLRRPVAIAALITSLTGLAGYFLFTIAGFIGISSQDDYGPANVTWNPNIGILLSILGCAACALAAFVMIRTRPPAPGEPR
jgi:hypothetical protein